MSRAVALHPWGVIVGVAVGGAIYGIIGALFAVPIMALTKVVVLTLRHWGSPEDLPPDVGEVAEAGADRIPDGEGAAVGEESTEPAD